MGSEVTNCYVIGHVGGDVGRIDSGLSPFFSYFRGEGMVLGAENMVH